jgi:hypothetical protein
MKGVMRGDGLEPLNSCRLDVCTEKQAFGIVSFPLQSILKQA